MSTPEQPPDDLLNRLRRLPSVHELLEREDVAALVASHPRDQVTAAIRRELEVLRTELRAGELSEEALPLRLARLAAAVAAALQAATEPRLRSVVNATGVLLQTNLGRAPLSERALDQIREICGGYCNLEFDLATGERGRRDDHVEELLLTVLRSRLAPARATALADSGAAVVNNCAAATFLALNTLAEGGEVIVSRGELVEIGGGFRIPEVLAKSGATLREVGTTNKTRIGDYAAAIGPATRLLLRVHRSNFRMEGFTEQPHLEELVALGQRSGVPVFDDQGTGAVFDLATVGLAGESSWLRSLSSGVAVTAVSGDKLLGGPQCGLLVGRREVVERMRANPLFRALRADKLTYAALQATLLSYLSGREADLPLITMLRLAPESIERRCQNWVAALQNHELDASVLPTRSVVGGGTTPGASLPSFAVALRHATLSDEALARHLRALTPPIVGRRRDGLLLLDLRTVEPSRDSAVIAQLRAALGGRPGTIAP